MKEHIDPRAGKLSMQEKVAELESRIVALEKASKAQTVVTRTTTQAVVNLEPELSTMWKAFDAVFAKMSKVFK